MFDNMRRKWSRDRSHYQRRPKNQASRETDWEYNARQKANQAEIDRILDKIRKSGYESLTAEEKHRLFDLGK